MKSIDTHPSLMGFLDYLVNQTYCLFPMIILACVLCYYYADHMTKPRRH